MLAFVSIAAILSVLQARERNLMRVQGRLLSAQQEAMDRQAIHAALSQQLALSAKGGAPHLRFDGTPFEMEFEGRAWRVVLQDVEGLIDLYLAPNQILRLAGLNPQKVFQVRERLRQSTPTGRMPSLEQTLAEMGISADKAPLLTQSARTGGLRPGVIAPEFRHAASAQPHLQAPGQTEVVRIHVQPLLLTDH